MLPQLRRLEAKYRDELVVVGVQAGKYLAERVTENIRQAALRLEIEHPIVNDRHFRIWRSYAVNAWPTIALVDPLGYYLGGHPGEITFEDFDPLIARLVEEYAARGALVREPGDLMRPLPLAEPGRPLAFPGKVLAVPDGRLFVADSGHNRVLVVQLDGDGERGAVREVVGRGTPGLADGDFASAAFYHPQGLALEGDTLYVADSENHAVRAVDLRRRQVSTVAGTGAQARRLGQGGPATAVPLSSPWDVLVAPGGLYVAMAGMHQLWRLDLTRGEAGPYAGSGRENIEDGALAASALAQPMGLACDGRRLFFADSEASAVRWAELPPGQRVSTIVGTDLFDYGDKDGSGDAVRLQHAQGLAWAAGRLYVADTYNNKVKLVDPDTRRASSLLGDGTPGHRDGDAPRFHEPGGLTALDDRLYVADTNNHAIRVADLRRGRVATLVLAFHK